MRRSYRRSNPYAGAPAPAPASTAGNLRREFESFAELVDAAANGSSEMNESGRSSRNRESSWNGGESWNGTLELARNGWPQGLRDVEALRADIHATGETRITQEVAYDVAGDEADIARMLSGEPEFMRRFEPTEVPSCGRVVKVVCNVVANGSVTPDELVMRGAAAIALVDCLENAGARCEVVLAFRSNSSGRNLDYFATVKRAQDSTDPDTLAFALAHPAVLRRLIFSLMEQMPEGDRRNWNVGCGYGHAQDVDAKDRGDVYIPSLSRGGTFSSMDLARRWVASEVARVLAKDKAAAE